MKLLLIFAISVVLLQYHFAATAPGDGSNPPKKGLINAGIPNYMITEKIDDGNTAKVYLAIHNRTGEEVAVKIVNKSKLKRDLLKNVLKEPVIMKELNHLNIAKLHEVVNGEKYLYIVMEHAPGGTIDDYVGKLKNRRMTEADARSKFRQIVGALKYLHQKHFFHRDLKTDNVLLDKSKKNIKLIDFGSSREFTPGSNLESFAGCLNFMAPEVIREEKYDGPRADIWSLGIILHEILTGKDLFTGESPTELLKEANEYRVPDFASPLCKDLLRKMLEVDPEDRLSVKEIMEHPWMDIGDNDDKLKQNVEPELDQKHQDLLNQDLIRYGYKIDDVKKAISEAKFDNDPLAAYSILQRKYLNAQVLAHST